MKMYNYSLFLLLLTGLLPQSLMAQVDADKEFLSYGKVDYSIGAALKKNGLGSFKTDELYKSGIKNSLYSGNLDNDNFGGGFKLHYSPYKTDIVDCSQNNVEPMAPQVTALAPLAISIACGQIKNEDAELYSAENCKLLESCAQMKLKREDTNYAGFFLTPKMAAEDYSGLMLEDHLYDMERLEALRKFSEKKFGKIAGASCKPQFDYSDKDINVKACDKDIVETGFSNFHESCQPLNKACMDLGKDFGNNTPETESALQNFYSQRIDSKVTEALSSDNEFLRSISELLSSKINSDEKLRTIFSKLKDLNEKGKLDPVFGFSIVGLSVEEMKKSPHYEFFKKLTAKPLTAASAKSAIEKHRRNFTKEVFNKSCKSSPSYMDICKLATTVGRGESAFFPSRAVAASRLKKVDSKHTDILKLLYPKGAVTDKDALIILNAQRCIAFGVNKPHTFADFVDSSFGTSASIGNGYNNGLGSGISMGSLGFGNPNPWALSIGDGFKYDSPDKADAKKASNDSVKIDFDDKSKLGGVVGNGLIPPVQNGSDAVQDTKTEKTLSDSFSDNFKNVGNINTAPVQNNQNFNHPNTNYNYSNVTEPSVNAEEKADKKSAGNSSLAGSPALNDRISELTKKLSATEEHLAKLKEDKEEADAQKAIQKKRDDDNQQIADLKKQITDLKTVPSKTKEAEKSTSVAVEATPANALVSRAPATESLNEAETTTQGHLAAESQVASRNAAAAVASSAGEAASPVRSSASTANALSSKNTITLTKVEGMSAEKFSESINDKIIELGGQSFEIEENGIKMEIVPEIKDGKILLDAKGKPRFVKKVKNAKESKEAKTRIPASVTDKADLQRKEEEALKHERAEYLKLKNITNRAIQTN